MHYTLQGHFGPNNSKKISDHVKPLTKTQQLPNVGGNGVRNIDLSRNEVKVDKKFARTANSSHVDPMKNLADYYQKEK